MINEVRFIMLAKKLEDFSEYFEEFYELINKWAEKIHSENGETAYITGISGFYTDRVEYAWECAGCSRGCCGYRSGDTAVSYDQLLKFIQGVE